MQPFNMYICHLLRVVLSYIKVIKVDMKQRLLDSWKWLGGLAYGGGVTGAYYNGDPKTFILAVISLSKQ